MRRIFWIGMVAAFGVAAAEIKATSEYPEFYNGDETKGVAFVQSIRAIEPKDRAEVSGPVKVVFEAPGMGHAVARCWRRSRAADGDDWGRDAVLGEFNLVANARGEFVFPAPEFQSGPVTIRIQASSRDGKQDYYELQLYNAVGTAWQAGLPKSDPPGARGMKLVFADDFTSLSVSPDGRGARYAAHKTGGGDFSGWPFSDPEGENRPFAVKDTYLRIHASKPEGTRGRTGILSSLRADGTGIAVPVPSYFECRLMCHSAPGSWGAFWTLTKGTIGMPKSHPDFERVKKMGCDELDVIECYGGYGPKNPNHGGKYGVTSHFWGQDLKGFHCFPDAQTIGGGSSWSWTFHRYGVAITETDTVYYLDDVEVLRHPTGPVSRAQETWFLINYAIAGISGWPYDLARYGNASDMWVDWVRVYCGKELPADFGQLKEYGVPGAVAIDFIAKDYPYTLVRDWEIAGADGFAQKVWNRVDVASPKLRDSGFGLVDSEGKPSRVRLAAVADVTVATGAQWGFRGGDERLHRGIVRGDVMVRNVPWKKWTLVVYLGADVNSWKGRVKLTQADGAVIGEAPASFGWDDGQYVEGSNLLVFRDLSSPEVTVHLENTGAQGIPALAGLQLVPAE
ncbi:MAG: hypothetical protein ACI4RA_07740 [Kiritimatiellia bacterium]